MKAGQAGSFLRADSYRHVPLELGHQPAIALKVLKACLDRVPDHGMEMVFESRRVYTCDHCDDWSQDICDIRAILFMISANVQR